MDKGFYSEKNVDELLLGEGVNLLMNNEPQLKSWIDRLKCFHINMQDKIAIYGTGDGAKLMLDVLKKIKRFKQVTRIIERDDSDMIGRIVFGKKVCRIGDCYRDIDIIIIGAFKFHVTIRDRLEIFCRQNPKCVFRIIDLFSYNTQVDKLEYLSYIERNVLKNNSSFIKLTKKNYNRNDGDTKVIAWYLPQYHELEINNKYWGKGFTEWTNTTRVIPMYTGHYQPHIPYDVGFYNLNNIETFKRQIYLAKNFAVYGFSFYYYWFSGIKFMEKPLDIFLKNRELDIAFCITWANENWTTLWDGGQNEIIYRQTLKVGDAEKFVDDLLPAISDSRYITVDDKPLIIIYRGNLFDKETMYSFIYSLRKRAQYYGFKDLYVMITTAGNFDEEVSNLGADALVEFPPHGMNTIEAFRPPGYINPYFVGRIYDTNKFINEKKYMFQHKEQEYYRAALTSWDNTARKARSGAQIYHGLSPETFKQWLWDIVVESKKKHAGEYDMVFVNAWNEWAEGAHLEPDMKYGYAYLQAVKDVIEGTRSSKLEKPAD